MKTGALRCPERRRKLGQLIYDKSEDEWKIRMTIGPGWISWIVVGLIAGWLAEKVMRSGGYGLIGDIIVGVVGGLLGGYLASNFLHIKNAMSGINVESILIAFSGAVVLLVGLRLLGGSRRRSILR